MGCRSSGIASEPKLPAATRCVSSSNRSSACVGVGTRRRLGCGLKASRRESSANAATATRRLGQSSAHLLAESSHQAVLRQQNFMEHLAHKHMQLSINERSERTVGSKSSTHRTCKVSLKVCKGLAAAHELHRGVEQVYTHTTVLTLVTWRCSASAACDWSFKWSNLRSTSRCRIPNLSLTARTNSSEAPPPLPLIPAPPPLPTMLPRLPLLTNDSPTE